MNIFNKVALQGLKKSRTRTLVTIIGVVLSAALITAVATFCVSLMNYLANSTAQKDGDWHVEFEDVNSSFAAKQAGNDKVANTATFDNIGYAKLQGGKDPQKPYLFIAGFNKKTFDTLPILLVSGRLPKNSGEIVVPGSVSKRGGVQLKVGDTLSLSVGKRLNGNKKLGQTDPYTAGSETLVPNEEKTYTVVGLCQTPLFEEESAPGYTVITTADASDTADDLSLFVKLKNPSEVHAYAKSTAGSHAAVLNNDVLRWLGLSDDSSDKSFTALMYSIGAIVILIVMIGSIFLIYNSFNISLNERTHQFGILLSVGATAKQLRHSVLFEGLCIGAVGIPIGILVGLGSSGLVISVVAKNFSNLLNSKVPLTVTLSVPAIVAAAAVSLVTILISADIPARKAANTPVMECIRQTNEVKVEAKAIKTSKLAQSIYGLEGTLALKNFKRNKKRYRSIVLSLVLSIVLFISTSALITDVQESVEQTKEVNSTDISFGTQDMDDREMVQLYDKLKTADGLTKSSYQVVMNFSCAAKASDLSDAYRKSAGVRSPNETVNLPIQIQFLDDEAYLKAVKSLGLPSGKYTVQNAKLIALAKVLDRNAQKETINQIQNIFKSSSVNLTVVPQTNSKMDTAHGQNVSVSFVSALLPDPPATTAINKQPKQYPFTAIAPYSLKEKLVPSGAKADIWVKGMTFQSKNPSQSSAEMKAIIQGQGIKASYFFINMDEVLEQNRNLIFIANVFAYTFIIMISLIAVANVFNTISTNIKLRRRELAMLRSVGMSDRKFNKMMRFECAFYGMKALLVGLPLSFVFCWLIYKGWTVGEDSIDFVLPWASIGISVVSVLLVIFITMMYAVGKIKKENIIDALRDDMD
ncbi:MAG TPA: FtsX-like permease family protein [Caproiciproducens sp.]|nr:FtsX-like permease family protein [Caproiciproducens sp.]